MYRQSCGGRRPCNVQRRHALAEHGSRSNFQRTCIGQTSQCSCSVYNLMAVPQRSASAPIKRDVVEKNDVEATGLREFSGGQS